MPALIDSGVPAFDALTGAVLATALGALALVGLVLAARVAWFLIRWIPASSGKKAALWTAVKVSWTWRRACLALNLFETIERTHYVDGKAKVKRTRKVPRIKIRVDEYGVFVKVRTLPKVGWAELQPHAQHFADTWGCTRVAIAQGKSGTATIRAVRVDPITTPVEYTAPPADASPFTWDLGVDEWAAPTDINLGNVPGVTIAGLPGYGKTALVNRGVVKWARSPLVQLAAIDGKDGGDYTDVAPRLFRHLGDDIEETRDFLREMNDHRRERSRLLRTAFGTKSIWNVPGRGKNAGTGPGFTEDWPLLVLIVDEAHTFFSLIRDGGDKKLKERNSAASENALIVEELVKKGRSVGIVVVLVTQKVTGDAIPTGIRDNCPVALSFALKTQDAAVAALGEDIRQHPDANPINLVADEYRLVATMARQDAAGFKRVRCSYVPDEYAAEVATETAHLTRNPLETIKVYADQVRA